MRDYAGPYISAPLVSLSSLLESLSKVSKVCQKLVIVRETRTVK